MGTIAHASEKHAVLPLLPIACAVLATSSLCAQWQRTPSVLDLDKTYHHGELITRVPLTSSGQPTEVRASRGTATLLPDHTFTYTSTLQRVFSTGATSLGPDNYAGEYQVTPRGRLNLDLDLANPRTDVFELNIDPQGTMMVGTRFDASDESRASIWLETSTGQSNAALNGSYRLIENLFTVDASGLTTISVDSTIVFDGAGNFTATGTEELIDPNGVSTTSAAGGSGTYSISADGTLTVGPEAIGAVSANGEVFFIATYEAGSTEVGLMIGVEESAVSDLAEIDDLFSLVAHEIESSTDPGSPYVFTLDGGSYFVASSTNSGLYSAFGEEFDHDRNSSPQGGNVIFHGTTALNAGTVQLFETDGAVTELILEPQFTPSRDFYIAMEQDGCAMLVFGTRRFHAAELYGPATPGTAGLDPEIGMREFPIAGTANFGLRIANARGGAPAAMVLALTELTFPLFGGTILFNPASLLISPPVTLGGAVGAPGAGAGTLPLSLPANTTLVGTTFFCQGLIIDSGAPSGQSFAMTQGLTFTLVD